MERLSALLVLAQTINVCLNGFQSWVQLKSMTNGVANRLNQASWSAQRRLLKTFAQTLAISFVSKRQDSSDKRGFLATLEFDYQLTLYHFRRPVQGLPATDKGWSNYPDCCRLVRAVAQRIDNGLTIRRAERTSDEVVGFSGR